MSRGRARDGGGPAWSRCVVWPFGSGARRAYRIGFAGVSKASQICVVSAGRMPRPQEASLVPLPTSRLPRASLVSPASVPGLPAGTPCSALAPPASHRLRDAQLRQAGGIAKTARHQRRAALIAPPGCSGRPIMTPAATARPVRSGIAILRRWTAGLPSRRQDSRGFALARAGAASCGRNRRPLQQARAAGARPSWCPSCGPVRCIARLRERTPRGTPRRGGPGLACAPALVRSCVSRPNRRRRQRRPARPRPCRSAPPAPA